MALLGDHSAATAERQVRTSIGAPFRTTPNCNAAPVGTPAPIIARLNAELNAILKTDEMKAELAKLSFEIVVSSAAEYRAAIAAEIPKWEEAVEAVGFTME